jgi:hypothetical protein
MVSIIYNQEVLQPLLTNVSSALDEMRRSAGRS